MSAATYWEQTTQRELNRREWDKSPTWRQVAENTQRRASFGRNTRNREPAARWNGVKP